MNQPSFQVFSYQDVGSRTNQEDRFAVSSADLPPEKGRLLVLCDGMGGMADGERFSTIGTTEMIRHFESTPANANPQRELHACFQAANRVALAEQDEMRPGGSTVVAVLLRNGFCSFLSLGDSRIYLQRGGGLIQLTRDQVLGSLLDERAALQIISPDEAMHNRRRSALTGCLGLERDLVCDYSSRPFEMKPGDVLAMMSDGVYNTLSTDELLAQLTNPDALTAQRVIEAVLQKNKPRQDNCSILLAIFQP